MMNIDDKGTERKTLCRLGRRLFAQTFGIEQFVRSVYRSIVFLSLPLF